jgi:hypothetical protein
MSHSQWPSYQRHKDLYWFGQFSYLQNQVAFVLIAREFAMGELQTKRVENVGYVLMLCPSGTFYSPMGWPLSTPMAPIVGQRYIICGSLRWDGWVQLWVSKVFSIRCVMSLQYYRWCCITHHMLHVTRVDRTATKRSLPRRVVANGCLSIFNTPQHPTVNVSLHWCLLTSPLWLRSGRKGPILDIGSHAAWLHKSDQEGILRNHRIKVDSVRPSHARLSRPRVMRTESVSEGTRGTTPGQFLSSLFSKTN